VVGPIIVEPGSLKSPDSGVAVPPDSGGHLIIIVGSIDKPDATGQGTPTTVVGPIIVSPPPQSAPSVADSAEEDEDAEID
jgi:hypothetical protein